MSVTRSSTDRFKGLRDAAESPIPATRHKATLELIAARYYLAHADAAHAARVALSGAHSEEADDQTIEAAVDRFRDEYSATFPQGGDAQDHAEAIREGVTAVLLWAGVITPPAVASTGNRQS